MSRGAGAAMVSRDQEISELVMKLRLTRLAQEQLQQRATADGSNIESVVSRLVEAAVVSPSKPGMDDDAWKRRFDAWMKEVDRRSDRYPANFQLDDSREKIYEDDGE